MRLLDYNTTDPRDVTGAMTLPSRPRLSANGDATCPQRPRALTCSQLSTLPPMCTSHPARAQAYLRAVQARICESSIAPALSCRTSMLRGCLIDAHLPTIRQCIATALLAHHHIITPHHGD